MHESVNLKSENIKRKLGRSNLRFLFSDLRFTDLSDFEFFVLGSSFVPLNGRIVIRIRSFLRGA